MISNIAKIIRDYKSSSGCYNCTCHDPDMLSFHHLNSMTKNNNISDMVSNGSSLMDIMKEITGTIIMCHNCHMKYHRELEFNYKIDTSSNQLSYIFEE